MAKHYPKTQSYNEIALWYVRAKRIAVKPTGHHWLKASVPPGGKIMPKEMFPSDIVVHVYSKVWNDEVVLLWL